MLFSQQLHLQNTFVWPLVIYDCQEYLRSGLGMFGKFYDAYYTVYFFRYFILPSKQHCFQNICLTLSDLQSSRKSAFRHLNFLKVLPCTFWLIRYFNTQFIFHSFIQFSKRYYFQNVCLIFGIYNYEENLHLRMRIFGKLCDVAFDSCIIEYTVYVSLFSLIFQHSIIFKTFF